MKQILTNYTASIAELQQSPSMVIQKAGEEAVAILNENKPNAYLVPTALYAKMIDELNAYSLLKKREEVKCHRPEKIVTESLDELLSILS